MKIPNEVTNKWKDLKDWGDINKISEESGIDRRKIREVMKGEGEYEAFIATRNFYKKREKQIKSV